MLNVAAGAKFRFGGVLAENLKGQGTDRISTKRHGTTWGIGLVLFRSRYRCSRRILVEAAHPLP